MLHRSFKPAKCKTALKLAVSRIKLMKNKMSVNQVQLRREVAQLLASGQERTARIRVEHVVREEKTMAAYDLLEVYCELIVARLPMIESQKNCPIDLKEAITSVIFASQRCADLPELQDIRKHLQSKYGKEFSTAAIELRPGCGVSRLMIEKLSVAAPDAQTKTKILSAIALEHSIDWDPKTSGENEENPHEDLLNGPNSFLRASQKYEEPPAQAPTVDTQKHETNLHAKTSSPHVAQNFDSSATPSTSQSQQGTPNVRAEAMEHRYTYTGDHQTFAAGKQNWNMEFTDATSAAHAAAEAAERASMAARAAAELSSGERIGRKQPSESQTQRLSVNDMRNASIEKHNVSIKSNANVIQDPANKFEHGGDPRIETDNFPMKNPRKPNPQPYSALQNQGQGTFSGMSQMSMKPVFGNVKKEENSKLGSSPGSDYYGTESEENFCDSLKLKKTNTDDQGNHTGVTEHLNQPLHVRGTSQSDSLKPKASFHGDEMFHNSYSQENIFSQSGQTLDGGNNAGKGGLDMGSSIYKSAEDENINYFADEILHEQSNSDSPRSNSPRLEDDHDHHFLDKNNDLDNDQFQAYNTETAVFDNSGSDDDVGKIDFTGGFKDDDPDPFRALDQKFPIHESPKRSSWFATDTSYDEFVSKPVFADDESSSTKLFHDQSDNAGSPHSHDSLPVAFDHSDSEAELDGPDYVVPSTHESLSRQTGFGAVSSNCECVTPISMIDEDEPQRNVSDHSDFSHKQSKSTKDILYTRQDETSIEKPSLDAGNELNLELLSGGFRNKGKKTPLYTKTLPDVTSLPSGEVSANDALVSSDHNFADSESLAKQRVSSLLQSKRAVRNSSPKFQASHYDLEDGSHSDDELPQTSIKDSQETRIPNASSGASHGSSFNSRSAYSDSNKFLNNEGTTEQVSRTKPHIVSSSVDEHKSSVHPRPTYLANDNLQIQEEPTVQESRSNPRLGSGLSRRTKPSTPDAQRKPFRETYGTASLPVMEPQTTELEEQCEVPKLARPIPRKSVPEVKRRPDKPSSSNELLESSNDLPKPKIGTASSSNLKTDQAAASQDSIKKASHVHPKLPDFDTLAAHFSSLRRDSK